MEPYFIYTEMILVFLFSILCVYWILKLRSDFNNRKRREEARRLAAIVLCCLFSAMLCIMLYLTPRIVIPRSYPAHSANSGNATPTPTPSTHPTLDEILSTLPWGNITYGLPKKIQLEQNENAWLWLSPKTSMANLQNDLNGIDNQRFARIQIANKMTARLKTVDTDALNIVPITPETQLVSFDRDTNWWWKIHAKKDGTYPVMFNLTINLKIDGESSERSIETYSNEILVEAAPHQVIKLFLLNYWQYILSTLALPLSLYVLNVIKKRNEKREAEKSEVQRRRIGF